MAPHFLLCFIAFLATPLITSSQDIKTYDSTAPTECKQYPEEPLYGGGILKGQEAEYQWVRNLWGFRIYSPAYVLPDLAPGSYYTYSGWVRVSGITDTEKSTTVWANVGTKEGCGANVEAKEGCWTLLKGGFFLSQPLNTSVLHFEEYSGNNIHIDVVNSSLVRFSEDEWQAHQQQMIQKERKRHGVIKVSDKNGFEIKDANIKVEQISRDFPFGVAISSSITGNLRYQEWMKKRFDVTVFENELKWPVTEPSPGIHNYTVADQMLQFVVQNKIKTRGHNVLWQDPNFTPSWLRDLHPPQIQQAAVNRIRSVVPRYRNRFIHWDVNNEMLHYDFYESKLGNPNASFEFYKMVQEIDPNVTLFFNDFKVAEECGSGSNVDAYIAKIKEFRRYGIKRLGMGIEGHFFEPPNPPFIRAVLDKFAAAGEPVWLTEVDVQSDFGPEKQAEYLEKVLREVFSHPAVDGIIIWAAMDSNGACWQMCLTDSNFKNTPAGDVVDKLLQEWHTGKLTGVTDGDGAFSFSGFLGTYKVTVANSLQNFETTISLSKGVGPQYFQITI